MLSEDGKRAGNSPVEKVLHLPLCEPAVDVTSLDLSGDHQLSVPR